MSKAVSRRRIPRRLVSLFLPSFSTDRLRARNPSAAPPAHIPFVTAGRDGARRILCTVDAAARKAGLHAGMPAAEAQAMLPGLALVEAEPERDAEALASIAVHILRRYSPTVALDPPDGLWIDTTGCDHLFGGEEGMLADLRQFLRAEGFACRVALAGTTGAAHALARFGGKPVIIVPPGRESAAAAALPLTALRLDEDVVAGLRRLGFETVGQLAGVPRAPLVRRFGMETVRRLDLMSGATAEPLDPIEPPDMPKVRLGFVEPIGTPEHLARAIADLAAMLCLRLAEEGLGARRLDLAFTRVDGRVETVRAGTAAPNREPRHLVRLLVERLPGVDPGFGVEAMTLAAPLVDPLDTAQIAAGFAGEAAGDIALLVDTLANRLGAHRLHRAAPVESDIPERAVRAVAPLAPRLGAAWPAGLPRPVRLFDPPEEVRAMAELPDHPPRQFIWRGERHVVTRADGPERLFGEWWRHEEEWSAVRDYFAVEDETGARFWLFRAGDGTDRATGSYRWFLQGLFT